MERLGVLVARALGHPRVAVAEHLDLVEADQRRRGRQLERSQLGQQRLLRLRRQPVERTARLAEGRVLQVALLAAGATHEHRVDVLGVVLGDGGGTLGRLVVGMGVNAEQREPVLHGGQASDGPAGRMSDNDHGVPRPRRPLLAARSLALARSHDASLPVAPLRSGAMRRRRTALLALAATAALAACDTDDGRQMQTPDSYAVFQLQSTTPSTTSTVAPPPTEIALVPPTSFAPPPRRRRRRRSPTSASRRRHPTPRRRRAGAATKPARRQHRRPADAVLRAVGRRRGDPGVVHVRRRRRRPADHLDGAAGRHRRTGAVGHRLPMPTASSTGSSSSCRRKPARSAVANRPWSAPRRSTRSAIPDGAARALRRTTDRTPTSSRCTCSTNSSSFPPIRRRTTCSRPSKRQRRRPPPSPAPTSARDRDVVVAPTDRVAAAAGSATDGLLPPPQPRGGTALHPLRAAGVHGVPRPRRHRQPVRRVRPRRPARRPHPRPLLERPPAGARHLHADGAQPRRVRLDGRSAIPRTSSPAAS